MVYEDIKQQQLKVKDSKGGRSDKGIITETITRFQASLPWLNQNNLNYFIRKQCVAMNILSTTVVTIPFYGHGPNGGNCD
jgi:hypothetical protein